MRPWEWRIWAALFIPTVGALTWFTVIGVPAPILHWMTQ